MDLDEAETLSIAEAAKEVGVPTSVLRHLARESALPGVVRLQRGQVRVRGDAVPTFDEVEKILQQRVSVALNRLRKAFDRVRTEMEAVGNDIAELEDDPFGPIGVDLESFDALSTRGGGTLRGALNRMTDASMSLQLARGALDELRTRY
jgi:DNA-binding transcriptional MerR regulator